MNVFCQLSFLIYMNWMDKLSQIKVCVTIRSGKNSRMLFANDLILLVSSESGLQPEINCFAAAGMKISTSKTEILQLLKNLVKCFL